MAAQTHKQAWRQEVRERGRYAKMNPCEVCGKGTGATYYSDPRTDRFGVGLVLCAKCCAKGEAMSDAEAEAFYRGEGAR